MTAGLAGAVESARRGRYEAALHELAQLGGRDSGDPRVLDLLARVHAQRGEFAEADSCWSRALELDPGSQDAAAGRRRIAALQVRRSRPSLAPVALAVVAGVAVAGVLLPAATPPPATAPPDTRVDQLQRELAALRADLAEPGRRTDQLVAALTGPGFTAVRQGEAVLVTFVEPVFTWSTRFSAGGGPVLADLGGRLKPLLDGNSVAVIGYGSTTDLGLRRALAAADRLGLPAGTVDLRSAGPAQATVTVLVKPA